VTDFSAPPFLRCRLPAPCDQPRVAGGPESMLSL
jgi:hypothetical protein